MTGLPAQAAEARQGSRVYSTAGIADSNFTTE